MGKERELLYIVRGHGYDGGLLNLLAAGFLGVPAHELVPGPGEVRGQALIGIADTAGYGPAGLTGSAVIVQIYGYLL